MTYIRVRLTPEVLETLFTSAGNRLRVDWGEPDAEGFYEPAVKPSPDPRLAALTAEIHRSFMEGDGCFHHDSYATCEDPSIGVPIWALPAIVAALPPCEHEAEVLEIIDLQHKWADANGDAMREGDEYEAKIAKLRAAGDALAAAVNGLGHSFMFVRSLLGTPEGYCVLDGADWPCGPVRAYLAALDAWKKASDGR